MSRSACEPPGYPLVLAARPGGGPLLVWFSGYGMTAALIATDGQLAGTPFDLLAPGLGNGGMFDAAWVGDAFNVALSIFLPPYYYDRALRIARIDVNGNVNGGFDLLGDAFEEMPRMARGATDTRVTYVVRDDVRAPAVRWRRFGPAGEFLANALVAEDIYNYTQSPAVAFGDDTLVLLGDDSDQSSSLAITRVGRDGNIVTPRYDILRAPIYRIGSHDMVRRGPDAIVSWLSYGALPLRGGLPSTRVGLARITP